LISYNNLQTNILSYSATTCHKYITITIYVNTFLKGLISQTHADKITNFIASAPLHDVDKDCPTLRRSKTIESGTPAQAKADGKSRLSPTVQ
jgi:hypothetical protein